MKKWKKVLLFSALEIAALLALHTALIRAMADRQIVSSILAANEAIPRSTIALATLFLVVRFMAVLALPGMILARIGLVLWSWFAEP